MAEDNRFGIFVDRIYLINFRVYPVAVYFGKQGVLLKAFEDSQIASLIASENAPFLGGGGLLRKETA